MIVLTVMVAMQIVACLATFPSSHSPLSLQDHELALDHIISLACRPPLETMTTNDSRSVMDESAQTEMDAGACLVSLSGCIVSTLRAMSSLGYTELLQCRAVPQLMAAAGVAQQPSTSGMFYCT